MLKLDQLKNHIQQLSEADWEKLFVIIRQIENAKSFDKMVVNQEAESGVMQFPYVDYSSLVMEFLETVHELQVVVVFDWMDWTEGKAIIEKQTYQEQDIITLCKLLTTIIRADRFSEGYLLSAFKHGDILAILTEMKKRIDS